MINWRTSTGTTNWGIENNHGEYNEFATNLIGQLEGKVSNLYLDTDGIPTIGIGFNLRASAIRELVFNALALRDVIEEDRNFATQIKNILEGNVSLTDVNNLMADALDAGDANRDTFTLTQAEITNLFPQVVDEQDFENNIDTFFANIPVSDERAALLSLTYNQSTASPLLGPSLEAALNDSDRAEAWYEIRYRSNGDEVAGKRRYVESEVFGLFDDDTADVTSVGEALLAFRVATKHEQWIKDYEAAYGENVMLNANQDLAAIGRDQGVDELEDVLEDRKVFDLLKTEFTELETSDSADLATAGYTGSLTQEVDWVWVAAPEQGPQRPGSSAEVDAHTVDRTSTTQNDLIFGNIDQRHGSTATNVGGDDTLLGGAGNDFLIGGDGNDSMDGGAGEDSVSYKKSNSGVSVDLAGGTASGDIAQGDTLAAIENVIGSDYNDTLTGNAGANVLIGGMGADSLSGGTGNDTLLGGNGDDTLDGGDGEDYLFGGAGNDQLLLNGSACTVDGGDGEDILIIYDTDQDAVVNVSGIEHIIILPRDDALELVGLDDVSDTSIYVTRDPEATSLQASTELMPLIGGMAMAFSPWDDEYLPISSAMRFAPNDLTFFDLVLPSINLWEHDGGDPYYNDPGRYWANADLAYYEGPGPEVYVGWSIPGSSPFDPVEVYLDLTITGFTNGDFGITLDDYGQQATYDNYTDSEEIAAYISNFNAKIGAFNAGSQPVEFGELLGIAPQAAPQSMGEDLWMFASLGDEAADNARPTMVFLPEDHVFDQHAQYWQEITFENAYA
ncbi:hypothetical protein [Kordiimonas aestuarii]|uniref:hypothetical protein n=1 Tax=Kordiimonas aestuarii TaxID=1005925 RepID=UPI002943D6B8|nr:hypothetical protein [Kordiimonas aestuarii]